MKKKTSFKMPELDEKATKKAIEDIMEEYRFFLATLPRDCMPKITQTYSDVPPSVTYQFHSSTEDAAIERAEFEKVRNEFMKEIHDAVNTLTEPDFFIITNAYMQQELGYDIDIWTELGVSRSKYYVMKGKALLRLAFALKKEVYKKKPKEVKTA